MEELTTSYDHLSEAELMSRGASIKEITLIQETLQSLVIPVEYLDDFSIVGISTDLTLYDRKEYKPYLSYSCQGLYFRILNLEGLHNKQRELSNGSYFNANVEEFMNEKNLSHVAIKYLLDGEEVERNYSLPWEGTDKDNTAIEVDKWELRNPELIVSISK